MLTIVTLKHIVTMKTVGLVWYSLFFAVTESLILKMFKFYLVGKVSNISKKILDDKLSIYS